MTLNSLSADASNSNLLTDSQAIERIFEHIDHGTTDVADTVWREPVEHYFDPARFDSAHIARASAGAVRMGTSGLKAATKRQ